MTLGELVVGALLLLGWVLRALYLRQRDRETALNDVQCVGAAIPCARRLGRRAVVAGGSWAGCLTARALLDHYDEVHVLESEDVSTDVVTCAQACNQQQSHAESGDEKRSKHVRANVSQVWQAHALFSLGRRIFIRLFGENAIDALKTQGGAEVDFGSYDVHNFGHTLKKTTSGIKTFRASRFLTESLARYLLCNDEKRGVASGRLTFRGGCRVKSLVTTSVGGRTRVCAVRVKADGAKEEEVIEADLVVDATGRSQVGSKWLAKLGVHVESEYFDSKIGYTGAYFKASEEVRTFKNGFVNMDDHRKCSRFSILLTVENDYQNLSVCGEGADYPPSTLEEMIEFLRGAPRSEENMRIIRALGQPTCTLHSYRPKGCSRQLYHKVAARIPEGFVATGDALACFNPLYGQGLTTAAVSVATLDRVLRRLEAETGRTSLDGLTQQYLELVGTRLEGPWMLPKSGDYCYEATIPVQGESKTEFKYRFMQDYMAQLFKVANRFPFLLQMLQEVWSMETYALQLFMPHVALLALLAKLNLL